MKKHRRKLSSRQFVIAFVEGTVMPFKGKTVSIPGLYSAYRREAERFGEPVSKERFLRIMDRRGYRRINGMYNGLYLDLTKA